MSGSEIRECPGCKHSPDDDNRYGKDHNGNLTGKKMRVHTVGNGKVTCTICSDNKPLKT